MSARAERRRAEKAAKKEARRTEAQQRQLERLPADVRFYGEARLRAQLAIMPPEVAAEYKRLNKTYDEVLDDPEGDAWACEMDERYEPAPEAIEAEIAALKAAQE